MLGLGAADTASKTGVPHGTRDTIHVLVVLGDADVEGAPAPDWVPDWVSCRVPDHCWGALEYVTVIGSCHGPVVMRNVMSACGVVLPSFTLDSTVKIVAVGRKHSSSSTEAHTAPHTEGPKNDILNNDGLTSCLLF